MKSDKNKLIIIFMILVIVGVIGITYAFFNYTRIGEANSISVGRIYFNTEQGNAIDLSNVFPISSSEATTDTVNAKTLSIEVTGDTDYEGGVEYLVTATDVHTTTPTGKKVPITLEVDIEGFESGKTDYGSSGLGNWEIDDYYANRESYENSNYKIEYDGNLSENDHILVGYIAPNSNPGTVEGVHDIINIKAYVNSDDVLITDTLENGPIVEEGYTNGTKNPNGKIVFTTEEWNSLTGSNALSFRIKVEAREGFWVTAQPIETPTPTATPINQNTNDCTFDVTTVNVTTYDINKQNCVAAVSNYGFSNADADDLCSGETIDYLGTEVDFAAAISALGMTLEQAEQQGLISNLHTGPATELVKGIEYVNGQYTYSYNNNGWTMRLTDKNSTDPVTTKMCTTVNNYPITSMQATFMNSKATSIDFSSFDTSNVTDMSGMFTFSSATSMDLNSFNTSNVTKMQNMFEGSQATSLNLSSFDTRNVTNMAGMFLGSQATSLYLSSFDTSNVTNMQYMFYDSQATSLDLSSFDTSNVTNMSYMFDKSRAATIYVSNLWNTGSVTSSNSMFISSAVVGQNGTRPYTSCAMNNNSWSCTGDTGNPLDVTYARIDNAPTSPGFFTYKAAPNN